ncbi:MAG: hypothetical protein IT259_10045 [Saprospiraceae bacterium]|nr:hypothetical protein [Saprospiraceae bacterium]
MRELIELVNVLNVQRLKADGLWGIIIEPNSKLEQLYTAIAEGRVRTDEEAIALLYPPPQKSSAYPSLKNKLKDRLTDTVFLLDFHDPAYTDRQKAFYECNKKWAAASVLLSKNAKLIGIDILENLLRHATLFEFTDLTLSILYTLRLHYGTIAGDQKKYTQYRDQYKQVQALSLMENEAEELYTHLVSHYVASKATKEELSGKAEEYFERIRPHLEKSDSFRLHLCGRLIETIIYTSKNDYAATARVCEEAIRFFESKPFESKLPLQAFYYQLVVCYTQMKAFEEGQAIIKRYQAIFDEGSFNWFKLQELYLLLAMHTRHYTDAWRCHSNVVGHPKFDNQPAQIREMWKIYGAYVHFLRQSGRISEVGDAAEVGKFRMAKFLNEIPTYAQDKRGMNIPILIIQILFLTYEQEYGQTIDRIEAIEKYCSRYLKQNDTFRSNCFIKMLLQMPAASFHQEAVLRKAEKLLDQLRSVPLEIANQTHEIEIIPYEDLWEMAVNALQNQIYKPRKKG